MKTPLVSIIIPAYNAEICISKIVKSILSQPFSDFELILVNDGSTDSTLDSLHKLKQRSKKIIIIDRPNGGPSAARNSGLKKAKGKYIMFFDSDDDIASTILVNMVSEIEKNNNDLAVCGWKIENHIRNTSRTIRLAPEAINSEKQNFKKYILQSIGDDGRLYNLWNKIFRADIIKKNNISFREDIRFGEDLLFSLDFFKHVKKMQIINKPLYYYQEQSETSVFSSSSLNYDFRKENWLGLEKFIGKKPDQEVLDLANWVKFRWFLSYCLCVCEAKMSFASKLSKISEAIKEEKLQPSKNSMFISKKKLFIERSCFICCKIPILHIILINFALLIKKKRKFKDLKITLDKTNLKNT